MDRFEVAAVAHLGTGFVSVKTAAAQLSFGGESIEHGDELHRGHAQPVCQVVGGDGAELGQGVEYALAASVRRGELGVQVAPLP